MNKQRNPKAVTLHLGNYPGGLSDHDLASLKRLAQEMGGTEDTTYAWLEPTGGRELHLRFSTKSQVNAFIAKLRTKPEINAVILGSLGANEHEGPTR